MKGLNVLTRSVRVWRQQTDRAPAPAILLDTILHAAQLVAQISCRVMLIAQILDCSRRNHGLAFCERKEWLENGSFALDNCLVDCQGEVKNITMHKELICG